MTNAPAPAALGPRPAGSPAALGPRPAAAAPAHPGLTRARGAVLDAVEGSAGPSSLVQLAATTGLHANTLREHLEWLLRAGLVRREAAPPVGRGRPAWLYRPAGRAGSPVAEYAGLASTLAAVISRTSPAPVDDAVAAGREWGASLARTAGGPAETGKVAARRQVVVVLDSMGFDPVVDSSSDPGHTTVRLTRCPLLDAARQHPDVVCGVHLGIASGALREYGADDSGTALTPFAEPGACLLRLSDPEPAR